MRAISIILHTPCQQCSTSEIEQAPARDMPATDVISQKVRGDADGVPVVEAGRMQLISYVSHPASCISKAAV